MRFEKWQALGNDYVIVEAAALPAPLTADAVRALCARHTGIGADGILLLEPADEPGFVARLRIFNPDGSEAELSGNGAREAIMYLRHRGWTDSDQFSILTVAGEIRPTILSATTCRVDMGRARDGGTGEVESGGRTWRFRSIAIGNPQCAIAVESVEALEALDLAAIGPAIERAPQFPNRTNVSWYAAMDEPGVLRARIFERGVGETTASGTGACGAAVAYVLRGGDAPVTVKLDGGDLEVDVADDLRVDLTGWAVPVYAGELSDADRVFAQRLGE
jgi:diaminopimelate epimerase